MTLIRKFWSLLFTVLLAGSVSTAAQAQSCARPALPQFRYGSYQTSDAG